MKKVSLSDGRTKFNFIALTLITPLVACFVILLNRTSQIVVIAISICSSIVLLLSLITTTVILLERVEIEGTTLTQKGFRKKSETDISTAVSVLTAQRTVGKTTTRAILILNKDSIAICTLSCFCAGKGYSAELIAMKIAKACNIEFIPTVDPKLYGKKDCKPCDTVQQPQIKTNFDEKDDGEIR